MKTYAFRMYVKTNGQEFQVGRKIIKADDADKAIKLFNKLDLPFHSYATYEQTCGAFLHFEDTLFKPNGLTIN
jgi:hypothetical protein